MPDAEEEDVGAGRRGLAVGDEVRQLAVEARIERRGRPSGERVRAERDRLEFRVGEQAVERLLAGVAGAAEDGSTEHDA